MKKRRSNEPASSARLTNFSNVFCVADDFTCTAARSRVVGCSRARSMSFCVPPIVVPNQTWFVTDRADTQDLGHLRLFASRASRQIGAMSSALFSSDTERLPVARTAELSEG